MVDDMNKGKEIKRAMACHCSGLVYSISRGGRGGLLGQEAKDVSLMLLPKELGCLFLVWGSHGPFQGRE